jgi:hypothetical protein
MTRVHGVQVISGMLCGGTVCEAHQAKLPFHNTGFGFGMNDWVFFNSEWPTRLIQSPSLRGVSVRVILVANDEVAKHQTPFAILKQTLCSIDIFPVRAVSSHTAHARIG